MRRIFGVVVAASAALWACGGGETAGGTTTGQASSTTSSSSASGSTSSGAGSGGGGGFGSGKICAGGDLCLQVVAVQAGTALPKGRLAVYWYALDAANKTPPLIAYDAAFDPAEARIDIPYAAIAPPPDSLMACKRSCMDPLTCPCTGDPALGFAGVAVGEDQNKDGKLSYDELASTLYGAAKLDLVYSKLAYDPAPAEFATIFPEGIKVGLHAYRVIPKSPFDQLGVAFDGTVFDLGVCPGITNSCQPPLPNLG